MFTLSRLSWSDFSINRAKCLWCSCSSSGGCCPLVEDVSGAEDGVEEVGRFAPKTISPFLIGLFGDSPFLTGIIVVLLFLVFKKTKARAKGRRAYLHHSIGL
ncbi:MAG: hypothetical protein ABFD50_01095 [Smithella sp.]